MINELKDVPQVKAVATTLTTTATSVGILTLFGIQLASWIQILTIIWFVLLIGRIIIVDVFPIVTKCFMWVKSIISK